MTNYITTEEWEQEVQKLGFIITTEEKLYVIRYKLYVVAISFRQTMFAFRINILPFMKLPKTMQEELYNLLDRYARTPMDKREPEKKYRLRLDIDDKINMLNGGYRYLVLSKSGSYYLSSSDLSEMKRGLYKITFTQSEIDEMGDITRGFVKEEVNE